MSDESILQSQLIEYAAQDLYPMHMPGHKRQQALCDAALPYGWDVTEVPETDDLHDAQGILREAMDRTAVLYGAARTWYLVNGSTVGLLAGIRAIAPYGSEVIIARNCHKAVYHAIELQGLHVHWIWPSRDPEFDIYESVDPTEIASALTRYPQSVAVILTSPTYEGVVSDIQSIAEICHRHTSDAHQQGIPLLVDEAHGAHLGFHGFFPDSAVHQGADIVIQSPHKTLPSLTQTAWLHLPQGSLVDPDAIERELDVFETSSPSYPLMVSLDTCTGILRERGAALFDAYASNYEQILRPAIEGLQFLSVYTGPHHDPTKVLISGRRCGLTGADLAEILRSEYRIETEMHLGSNVLAMTSICDTTEGFRRLADALQAIDQQVERIDSSNKLTAIINCVPEVVMTVAEAMRRPCEQVENPMDRIAAEYVYAYPPGIPIIVPGERITSDLMQEMQRDQIHHPSYRVIQEER